MILSSSTNMFLKEYLTQQYLTFLKFFPYLNFHRNLCIKNENLTFLLFFSNIFLCKINDILRPGFNQVLTLASTQMLRCIWSISSRLEWCLCVTSSQYPIVLNYSCVILNFIHMLTQFSLKISFYFEKVAYFYGLCGKKMKFLTEQHQSNHFSHSRNWMKC